MLPAVIADKYQDIISKYRLTIAISATVMSAHTQCLRIELVQTISHRIAPYLAH